jgi:hypothetical protein
MADERTMDNLKVELQRMHPLGLPPAGILQHLVHCGESPESLTQVLES